MFSRAALGFLLVACGPSGGSKLREDTAVVHDTGEAVCPTPPRWYADADGDGFGDFAASTVECDAPQGFVADDSDCDDTDANVNPGAPEVCNGLDDDCDTRVDDDDDSLDPTTRLSAFDDADGDGFGNPATEAFACALGAGQVLDGTDCDDTLDTVHPGATEVCNGVDDDCDGEIDQGVTLVYYPDGDADGYGDATAATSACEPPEGYVEDATDCDDTDAAVSPGATEVCNGLDDDCEGTIDQDALDPLTWYADADADGYGDPSSTTAACDAPAGSLADNTDCDDTDAAVHPGATERCNGLDDDCDGRLDSDAVDAGTWYADADADGYGDASSPTVACDAPAGYLADNTDCDDTDADAYPGAAEVCGGADLDCDGNDPEACTSCAEALADGYTGDGLYHIDVDGFGGAVPDLFVWCDQTTDGGGWTLVQRTVWDWSETSLLLTDYSDWYRTTLGAATPGDVFRLSGVQWGVVGAGGQMLAMHVDRDSSSLGDCDPLYYTGSGGTLTVSSSTATFAALSSSPLLTNVEELSTTDSGPSTDCVNSYGAVPWFYSTCCTTCPSFQGSYWADQAHPMASYTDSDPDIHGKLASDVCPSGAALPNENGGGYEGINVMEIYLR